MRAYFGAWSAHRPGEPHRRHEAWPGEPARRHRPRNATLRRRRAPDSSNDASDAPSPADTMADHSVGDADMDDFYDDAQPHDEVLDADEYDVARGPMPAAADAARTPATPGRPPGRRATHHSLPTPSSRTPPNARRLASPPQPPAAGTPATARPDSYTLADIMAAIQHSRSEHSAAIAQVADRQAEHTAAIDELGQCATTLESTVAQTHDDVAALAERVKALEAGSRPGSSAPSSAASGAGHDPHRADRSILRISVRGMAARDAVETAIRPLLAAARVRPTDVRLDGSVVARSFVLRVLPSSDKPADEVVRTILDNRRLPSGG